MTEQFRPPSSPDLADEEAIVDALDRDPETPAHQADIDPEAAVTEDETVTSADEVDDDQHPADEEREPGQVSEAVGLHPEDAGTPIRPSDATAGAPDGESGRADEGAAGPNGVPPEHRTA